MPTMHAPVTVVGDLHGQVEIFLLLLLLLRFILFWPLPDKIDEEQNSRHAIKPPQYYDLINLLKIGGQPGKTQYLFLGDYVDRYISFVV